MSKKLDEDVKLRRLIRRTIESKKNYLDKEHRANYRLIISQFLEKFTLCEAGTKRALAAYYKSEQQTKDVTDITMDISDIKRALTFAGFDTETLQIEKMFRKGYPRGSISVRDLRNGIIHDLRAEDIDELVDRWDDIQEIMDNYLNILQKEPLN